MFGRVLRGAAVAALVSAGIATGGSASAAVAPDAPPTADRAGVRLTIPAIKVNAGIIKVGTRGGKLAIGRSVRDVYAWKYGSRPGQDGSAVLAGHTWSKGPGVFDNLGRLKKGNLVHVGRFTFKINRVRKVSGMNHAAVRNLFSDVGPPRLVLITCGDRNNLTGVYRTRIIVEAKKIKVKRSS